MSTSATQGGQNDYQQEMVCESANENTRLDVIMNVQCL